MVKHESWMKTGTPEHVPVAGGGDEATTRTVGIVFPVFSQDHHNSVVAVDTGGCAAVTQQSNLTGLLSHNPKSGNNDHNAPPSNSRSQSSKSYSLVDSSGNRATTPEPTLNRESSSCSALTSSTTEVSCVRSGYDLPVGFEVSLEFHKEVSSLFSSQSSSLLVAEDPDEATTRKRTSKAGSNKTTCSSQSKTQTSHTNNNHNRMDTSRRSTRSTREDPSGRSLFYDEFSIRQETQQTINRSESMQPLQQQQQQQASGGRQTPPSSSSSKDDSILKCAVDKWTKCTQWLHYAICQFVLAVSLRAARNPRSCIAIVLCVSLGVIATGFFTNFYVEANEEAMFAPTDALSRQHGRYVSNVDGFPEGERGIAVTIHRNGDNVVGYEVVNRAFMAVDFIRSLPEVQDLCSYSPKTNDLGAPYCQSHGLMSFWNENSTLFRQETQGSDQVVIETISKNVTSEGTPFFHDFFMGRSQRDPKSGLIFEAKMIVLYVGLPDVKLEEEDVFGQVTEVSLTPKVESAVIDALRELRKEWADEPGNVYKLEFLTMRSLGDELVRAIADDIPLIPLVFFIMTGFTCFVFYRNDPVKSRSMVGIGSVVTILMSIMTGFGMCFAIGVPFTSMTQILPFVIFGVGLDDTFIITGAYFRTNPNKETVERIRETMEEVGNSISLTTITTTVAFLMGLISTIPSIQWLCIYAAPTIFIDYVYQITFFVAILVLDEERIKANRRDCCICFTVSSPSSAKPSDSDSSESDSSKRPLQNGNPQEHSKKASSALSGPPSSSGRSRVMTEDDDSDDPSAIRLRQNELASQDESSPASGVPMEDRHWADRFMDWYADKLMHPCAKVFVLIGFTAFLGACIYSSTQLVQSFRASDFLPTDSYALAYVNALSAYTVSTFRIPVYFRYVDQSDPQIQEQMQKYVDEVTRLQHFQKEPEACWFRDFKDVADGNHEAFANYSFIFENNWTFYERFDVLMSIPEVYDIYGGDIALNPDGTIETSRCWFSLQDLNVEVVREQVQVLADLHRVSMNQTVNQGREDDMPFFAFESIFFLWDFYTVVVAELQFTTISGVIAITAIGFLLIPHWSATMFVTPLIMVLYVDLLGTIQFAGLAINPLTYVCLVISIGLLVDFLMHIILRYYESAETTREAKVKDTLRTMGASILVGGLSTCLGVVPLAFSSSGILKTVFISFIAMVTLGIGHGLILLPVLLSYWGPTVCVRMNQQDLERELHIDEHAAHGGNQQRDIMATSDRIDEEADADVPPSVAASRGPVGSVTVNRACQSFDSTSTLEKPGTIPLFTRTGHDSGNTSYFSAIEDVDVDDIDDDGAPSNPVSSVFRHTGEDRESRLGGMDLIEPSDSISV
ncbi:Pick C1-like protein 1 [Seminavis robusta]|uniref:Pick C1-like protein 1 n=1 Tax=Seminavis robusta TaxID=568900 RepID=A0A9N8DGB0_9STRA|nr:Pick C1-like protein 1 [Seminavis robusta]|eukprot:Sro78_g042390.1 Pick C1-like protein 1 (1355) ;mRNA; r:44853-49211